MTLKITIATDFLLAIVLSVLLQCIASLVSSNFSYKFQIPSFTSPFKHATFLPINCGVIPLKVFFFLWTYISNVVDHGFEPRSVQNQRLGICGFSAKHAAFGKKSKEWLARNHDESEWGDMFIPGLLFQWASTIKLQLISFKRRHDMQKNCWVGIKQQSLTHKINRKEHKSYDSAAFLPIC